MPILVHAMAESGRGDPTEAFNPPLPPHEVRPAGTLEEVIEFLNEDAVIEEPGGLFCYQNDAWGCWPESSAARPARIRGLCSTTSPAARHEPHDFRPGAGAG